MNGLAAIDGTVTSLKDARITADDRGLLFGDALSEVICAIGSRLIDFAAHMNRLRASALQCRISIPWTDQELRFELEHLLSLTQFSRSSLKMIITRGSGLDLLAEPNLVPHRYIYCSPAKSLNKKFLEEGLRLKIKRHPAVLRGPQHKSTFYLPGIVAQFEIEQDIFDGVLWSNHEGEISEGTSANVFLISRDGDLVEIASPPPSVGLLPGITRARIIDLLVRSKIPVTERKISIEELPRFDEGFLTSSISGLLPIQSIDRHRLHSTRPQAVFHHISRLYKTWESQEDGSPLGEEDPLN